MPAYEKICPHVYIFPRIDKKYQTTRAVWQLYVSYKGNRIRKSLGTEDREIAVDAAYKQFDDLRRRILLGHSIEKVSFDRLCDEYLDSISDSTKATYQRWPIETYYRKFFGAEVADLAQLSDGLVADYLKWRAEISAVRPKAKTLNRERTAFIAMMKFAVRKNWLTEDQIPDFPWQRESQDPSGNYIAFTSKEWSAFLSKTRSEISRAEKDAYRRGQGLQYLELFHRFAKFMVYTGIRPDREFRDMQWRKINFNDGIMYVDGKKGERVVPLAEEAMEILKDMREARTSWLRSRKQRMGRDEYVWCLPSGKRVKSFKRQFKRIMDRMTNLTHDKSRYAPYSFRHTFATFRLRHGVSPEVIMKAMGTGPNPFYRSYNQLMSHEMKQELFKHMKGYEQL